MECENDWALSCNLLYPDQLNKASQHTVNYFLYLVSKQEALSSHSSLLLSFEPARLFGNWCFSFSFYGTVFSKLMKGELICLIWILPQLFFLAAFCSRKWDRRHLPLSLPALGCLALSMLAPFQGYLSHWQNGPRTQRGVTVFEPLLIDIGTFANIT